MLKKYIIKDGYILSTYRDSNVRLATSTCKKGYHRLTLTQDCGTKKTFLLHRLVAMKHIPNPEDLPQVNHKDGDKDNNQISNLEWCTNDYNTKNAVSNNLIPRGKSRSNGKLSNDAVRNMRTLRAKGYTYYTLGTLFNVAYQTAHKVCIRQTYTHID
jgi:hypothetical protein